MNPDVVFSTGIPSLADYNERMPMVDYNPRLVVLLCALKKTKYIGTQSDVNESHFKE